MPGRFGRLAKRQRLEAEISLRSVARDLGLTPAYVSDIERGHRNPPSPDIVRRWAKVIGADEEQMDRVARIDRQIIELEVNGDDISSTRNDVAVALARRWSGLTEKELQQLIGMLKEQDDE